MRRPTRAWGALCIVLALGALRLDAKPSETPSVEVLCLHSYHPAAWTDAIMAGYRDALGDLPHITFQVEYMDTKRLQTPVYLEQLAGLYRTKYAGTSFDGILVSDNHALSFALEHRAELFPEVPVVFCGINRFRPEILKGAADVTGVIEQGDFAQTLRFVRRARPKMRRLHVICDSTRTGRLNLVALRNVVSREHPDLQFSVLDGASLDSLCADLARVPSGDAVFFISYWADAEGHPVTIYKQSNLIRSSPAPVFGRSEWLMGEGLAGGMCVRGQRQGESAGRLLRRILEGVDIQALPVVTESPNEFMVDLAVFRHYRLPRKHVPADAVAINALRPVLEVRRSVARLTLALIGGLMLLVGILMLDHLMRRRYARRLAASEAKYREVFDGAGEAIFIHDALTGRILDVNRTMLQMYGVTYEQALALTPEACSSGEAPYTAEEAARRLSRARREGPQTFKWHARRMDGSTFWGQVMLTHSPHNGQDRILAVVRDVTERRAERARSKVLRKSLVQARRLESLGLLAGGVAHDLNNTLGPVLAMPGLIDEELENVLRGDRSACKRVREDLAGIESGATRAAETIKDLLMLSRQGGVEKRGVDLAEVVENALASREIGSARAGRPELELTFHREQEVPHILGATTNLSRAVENVVRNALEAVGPRGHVVLTLTRSRLEQGVPGDPSTVPGDYAHLRVCDDGCGIPEDQVDRVFDPFFSKKARSASSGTGMGLPIVHSIVRDHGGGILLQSVVGEGTTVDLYLPLPVEPLPTETSPDTGDALGGTENLWVVDDDPGQRLILQRILQKRGYHVETMASGEAAVARIEEGPAPQPDLLLMDIMMGEGLTGIQALRQVRSIVPDIRAVIVSGVADEATVADARRLGAQWISKPCTPHELARHVRLALEAETLFPAE